MTLAHFESWGVVCQKGIHFKRKHLFYLWAVLGKGLCQSCCNVLPGKGGRHATGTGVVMV
eukprot:14906548-Ditylum_brightwellii.AAC.2